LGVKSLRNFDVKSTDIDIGVGQAFLELKFSLYMLTLNSDTDSELYDLCYKGLCHIAI